MNKRERKTNSNLFTEIFSSGFYYFDASNQMKIVQEFNPGLQFKKVE